jgi:hypothetical protein
VCCMHHTISVCASKFMRNQRFLRLWIEKYGWFAEVKLGDVWIAIHYA